MATLEQEKVTHAQLQKVLGDLNAIDPETLVRAEVLGKDLSFEAGLPVFRRTLGLFRDLSTCNLENFPFETLTQLHSQANQVLSYFNQVKTFSIQQFAQNPVATRDQLIAQIRDTWHGTFSIVTPSISYSVRRGTDFDALEREARGTLALQKQIGTEFVTEKDKILAEMQGALARVREAAAEAGVAQHAIHFKEEAEFHKKQSLYWLFATIASGIITILYAVYSLAPDLTSVGEISVAHAIELIVPRFVVILVLTFGLVWCARNFGASRHNFVVNRHRQNALSSFETFVKGASELQTKDAVLLQATQSIFTPQDSGFVKGEGVPQLGSQVIEVLRGTSGAKSS